MRSSAFAALALLALAGTSSNNWNAGTTEPAGSTSIFRRPPAMSLTFLAKSAAYSWKMSLAGQVLWNRMLTVWAVEIIGAASAPAAPAALAAFFRKRRRGVGEVVLMRVSYRCCVDRISPCRCPQHV